MSFLKTTEARLVIIAIIAIPVIIDLFVDIPPYNNSIKTVINFGVVIAGFMALLAAVNLGRYHTKHILKRAPGQWYFSIYTLLVVIITFFMGVLSTSSPVFDEAYTMLIKDIFITLSSATYGLVGFYFTSSLFRSFRARNTYVALFLIAGCFVIFANAPIFGVVHPGLQSFGAWIRSIPGVAGTRGIILGSAVGIIAAGLRTLLGYERASIGGEEVGA